MDTGPFVKKGNMI